MNDRETKKAIKFLKERARLDARRRPVVDLNDALKALKLAGHNISIRHIVEID
jgi:ribosomal protein L4